MAPRNLRIVSHSRSQSPVSAGRAPSPAAPCAIEVMPEGTGSLVAAIKSRRLADVEATLEEYPNLDLNAVDTKKRAPLHHAIASDATKVFQYLLARGAVPRFSGPLKSGLNLRGVRYSNAFDYAVQTNHPACVALICKWDLTNHESSSFDIDAALNEAKERNLPAVQAALEIGAREQRTHFAMQAIKSRGARPAMKFRIGRGPKSFIATRSVDMISQGGGSEGPNTSCITADSRFPLGANSGSCSAEAV